MTRAELVERIKEGVCCQRGTCCLRDQPEKCERDSYLAEATAALAAIEAAGFVCVPRGVTKEMADADPYGMGYGRIHAIWTRMLAASPLAQEPNDDR